MILYWIGSSAAMLGAVAAILLTGNLSLFAAVFMLVFSLICALISALVQS